MLHFLTVLNKQGHYFSTGMMSHNLEQMRYSDSFQSKLSEKERGREHTQ